MSIAESYEIAFNVSKEVRNNITLDEDMIIYPSAWYENYWVLTIRNPTDDKVDEIKQFLNSFMKNYSSWKNSKDTQEDNLYHIHYIFDEE